MKGYESFDDMAARMERERKAKDALELSLSLFAPLDPPTNGTPTSSAAARSIAPRAMSLRVRVLVALVAAGERGMTREEVESMLQLDGSTVRPRVVELLYPKDGPPLVYEQGERLTVHGHPAAILRATQAGYVAVNALQVAA